MSIHMIVALMSAAEDKARALHTFLTSPGNTITPQDVQHVIPVVLEKLQEDIATARRVTAHLQEVDVTVDAKPLAPALLDHPLSTLGLGALANKWLHAAGYKTIRDLLSVTREELMKAEKITQATLADIEFSLTRVDLKLGQLAGCPHAGAPAAAEGQAQTVQEAAEPGSVTSDRQRMERIMAEPISRYAPTYIALDSLQKAGVHTVLDASRCTAKRLLQLPGVGFITVDKLRKALHKARMVGTRLQKDQVPGLKT